MTSRHDDPTVDAFRRATQSVAQIQLWPQGPRLTAIGKDARRALAGMVAFILLVGPAPLGITTNALAATTWAWTLVFALRACDSDPIPLQERSIHTWGVLGLAITGGFVGLGMRTYRPPTQPAESWGGFLLGVTISVLLLASVLYTLRYLSLTFRARGTRSLLPLLPAGLAVSGFWAFYLATLRQTFEEQFKVDEPVSEMELRKILTAVVFRSFGQVLGQVLALLLFVALAWWLMMRRDADRRGILEPNLLAVLVAMIIPLVALLTLLTPLTSAGQLGHDLSRGKSIDEHGLSTCAQVSTDQALAVRAPGTSRVQAAGWSAPYIVIGSPRGAVLLIPVTTSGTRTPRPEAAFVLTHPVALRPSGLCH